MTQPLETTVSILVSNRMVLTTAFVQVGIKSLIQLNVMVGITATAFNLIRPNMFDIYCTEKIK